MDTKVSRESILIMADYYNSSPLARTGSIRATQTAVFTKACHRSHRKYKFIIKNITYNSLDRIEELKLSTLKEQSAKKL